MKVREGFVSNSSSSSFVMVAVKMTSDEVNKMYSITDEDDDFYDILERDGYFYEYERGIFGIMLASSGDDSILDNCEYTLDDLAHVIQNVAEKTGKSDVKLIAGERGC